MCYQILIAHPARHALPDAGLLTLRVRAMAGLPRDVAVVSVEQGTCACNLVWHEGTAESADRWRRRGWSEAKIQRALHDRTRTSHGARAERRAFATWFGEAATTTPGLRVYVSDVDEAAPTWGEATTVTPEDFLEAPLRYEGAWVRVWGGPQGERVGERRPAAQAGTGPTRGGAR